MEKDIEYWYPSDYKMGSYQEEVLYRFLNNNDKVVYNIHHYSCSRQKFPKLNVGEYYWIDISESLMSHSRYRKCKVTYIRSGVIFYIVDNEVSERWFAEGSLQHAFTAPLEITVNLDPEYYKIVDQSGLMKVNYIGKLIKND